MASRSPLVIIQGVVQNIPDGDQLTVAPVDMTLTYVSNRLSTVSTVAGTKTFTYSGSRLDTISDTETGKISTFNYTGNNLTSVTITDI